MNILINEGVYKTLRREIMIERSNILFEKTINISNKLEDFLWNIRSPLALDLLEFLQSDDIKDGSNVDELDLDDDNPTIMKATVKTQRGDKLQNMKFVKGLKALGGGYLLQKYHERDIQELLSKLKAMGEGNLMGDELSLEVWDGNEIYYAYNCKNYTDKLDRNSGLNQSCMKYEDSQQYLQIYADNPSAVSCLVLVDNDGLIHGRALIWDLDYGGEYMDRIYVAYGHYAEYFMQYANQRSMTSYQNGNQHDFMEVTLNHGKYDYYPYMDTFAYAYKDEGGDLVLTNDENVAEMELEQTDGGYISYVVLYDGIRQRKSDSVELFDGRWASEDDPDLVDMHDGTVGVIDLHDIVELDGKDEWAKRKDVIKNADGGWELKPNLKK